MIRPIFIRPRRRCRCVTGLRRSAQTAMLILGVVFSCQAYASKENSRPLPMNTQKMKPDESDEMEKIFKDHPEKFTKEIIAAYRAKKIILVWIPTSRRVPAGSSNTALTPTPVFGHLRPIRSLSSTGRPGIRMQARSGWCLKMTCSFPRRAGPGFWWWSNMAWSSPCKKSIPVTG